MPLRRNKGQREARHAEPDRQDREPSCPRFSEIAADGRCPRCRGTSFMVPGLAAPTATGEFLIGGAAGAVIGAAAGATSSDHIILCVTCGKRFRRG